MPRLFYAFYVHTGTDIKGVDKNASKKHIIDKNVSLLWRCFQRLVINAALVPSPYDDDTMHDKFFGGESKKPLPRHSAD